MPASSAAAPVSADAFRDVIGHFATGVTVITSKGDDRPCGMTASAVSSLSLEPPMLLICVNRANATHEAIARCGAFAVNILGEHQAELAGRFATRGADKFGGLELVEGPLGQPMLRDALAVVECSVAERISGGTHEVYLGRVVHAEAHGGAPLTYFRGGFGWFATADDLAVYHEIRQRILASDAPIAGELEIDALRDALGLDPPQVRHALSRLVAEGLVVRRPDGSHVVTPLDVAAMQEAFDARSALELAVIEEWGAKVTIAELDALQARMEATASWIEGDRIVDLPAYVAADDEFHAGIVALSGNPLLGTLYRRIGVEGIMLRAKHDDLVASGELIDDHRAIVDALRRGDVTGAKAAVRTHTGRAKRIGAAAIERAAKAPL
jgi:flavin reductase (DIM6/NTAB) family NADH-FMN oxidoreductase RutF/DNA-binding FadR family transcriptional regulator